MSLNEKYIINGSTLSDIGDALRSKLPLGGAKIVSTTAKARSHYIYVSGSTSAEFKTFFPDLTPAYWYYDNTGGTGYITDKAGDATYNSIYLSPNPTGKIPATKNWYVYAGTSWTGDEKGWATIYPLDQQGNFYQATQEQEGTEKTGSFNLGVELIQVSDIAQTITNLSKNDLGVYLGANVSEKTKYKKNIYKIPYTTGNNYDWKYLWDIDPEKILMLWCYMGSNAGYQHLYVRDITGFMTNSSRSLYFFPNIRWGSISDACKNYNTKASNPAVNGSNYYYSFSFDNSSKQLAFARKVTAYSPNSSITITAPGGMGSTSAADIPFVAIFEN